MDPSFAPGAASDLEAMLPSTVNDVALTKMSFDGASAPAGISLGDAFVKVLSDNGKSAADVRIAVASALAADGTTKLGVEAVQIRGTSAATWALNAFSASTASPKPATIGGKSVLNHLEGDLASFEDIYAKDDVAFWVLASDATLETAALTALP